MNIQRITRENAGDLRLKNDSFFMPGQFVPMLNEGIWSYRISLREEPDTMRFPDEDYEFDKVEQQGCAFAAYEGDTCVGLIVLKDSFWNYMYVYDLKVSAVARGKGIGGALIRAGMEEAKRRNYGGLYLQAQDNNLNACLFYLKQGFQIGGFDNRVYHGTSQQGKADVLFYLDADSTCGHSQR